MFFLFGWGHTIRKHIGPAFTNVCPQCNNESLWEVQRISVWFTLFFIPVFPYEWKYILYCPVCTAGIVLDSTQRKDLIPLAEANKLLLTGKISEDEHRVRLSNTTNSAQLESPTGTHSPPETKAVGAASEPRGSFCTKCGTKVDPLWKFCQGCGVTLN